jgi:hypothetical protein
MIVSTTRMVSRRIMSWSFSGLAMRSQVLVLLAAELFASVPAEAGVLQADVNTANALIPNFINESSHHTGTTGTAASSLDKLAYARFHGNVLFFGYHGTGTASASFPSLGASSEVILNDFSNLEYNSSTILASAAQADDDITVPGSGPGFFQLLFHLSGSGFSTSSLIEGGVFFSASAGSGGVSVNSFALGFLPTGDLQTPLAPITFGVPFHIRTFLETSIEIVGAGTDPGPIDAGIFYGHTAAITGVNVFDANGAPLRSFTILSDSGTDYAHPQSGSAVPEPSSIILWGIAALCLTIGSLRRRRRAGAMIHRATCLLACVVAVLGIQVVAQAGQITYDFVNPATGANGYDLRGSITVDSTGISAAPIDLTTSMVQSWHISVFNSSNVLQFSLSSPTDTLSLEAIAGNVSFAPQITLSSLYLPVIPFPPDNGTSFETRFNLARLLSFSPLVEWVASTINAPPFIPNDYTRLAASDGPGTILYDTGDSSQSPFTIAVAEPTSAVIPEPSSLVIAMTLFGTIGLAGVWQRSRNRQASQGIRRVAAC